MLLTYLSVLLLVSLTAAADLYKVLGCMFLTLGDLDASFTDQFGGLCSAQIRFRERHQTCVQETEQEISSGQE